MPPAGGGAGRVACRRQRPAHAAGARRLGRRATPRCSLGGGDGDHYAALGVARGATQEELRAAYRATLRRVHPDASGGDAAAALAANEAYRVLADTAKRDEYDRWNARAGLGVRVQRAAAEDGKLVPSAAACELCGELSIAEPQSRESLGEWLQQWASTLAFGSELPLPEPLQVDVLPGGAVRLAAVRVGDDGVAAVGDLRVEVAEDDASVVRVTRCGLASGLRAVPGEERVLKSLRGGLARLSSSSNAATDKQPGLSGFAAALGAAMLPLTAPFGSGTETEGTYDGYHLLRRK